MFGDMKHGEQRQVVVNGKQFGVDYYERPSEGDNGKPVRGATTGTFTVEHPNGRTSSHYHGPHANTEAAAKRGASRDAKGYAAREALEAVTKHAMLGHLFNDKRR